jgi:hypothetical protein
MLMLMTVHVVDRESRVDDLYSLLNAKKVWISIDER